MESIYFAQSTASTHGVSRRSFTQAVIGAATLSAIGLAGTAARAQQATGYPSRALRMVIPFPPGGPNDVAGRAVAQKLSGYYHQPVIVDNRAGAGGIIGAEVAAKAAPDGYTIFVCTIHHAVLPALRTNLSYDIERDFVPLSYGATFPIVLVVHPSLPVTNVKELIAYEKAHPGTLSFASTGAGGGTHLAGELFNLKSGTRIVHVPYKGSAAAMSDLLGGQIPIFFSDAPTALPHIKAGKIRALAVAGAQRSALLPELPTIAESGLPNYEAYTWAAFMAPKGTPPEIARQLSADLGRALADPDVVRLLANAGAEAKPSTPEELARLLRGEIAKWGDVVRQAAIKVD